MCTVLFPNKMVHKTMSTVRSQKHMYNVVRFFLQNVVVTYRYGGVYFNLTNQAESNYPVK